MYQLFLEPSPGTYARQLGGQAGRTAKPTAGWPKHQSQVTAPSWPLLLSQVQGASEEPAQFSLINAAGTHSTNMGISSPVPGELVFSSFHSLLSGPYFWNLPECFRGDKVGRGWEEKGNSRQQELQRLGVSSVVVLWRRGGRGGWSSRRARLGGPR